MHAKLLITTLLLTVTLSTVACRRASNVTPPQPQATPAGPTCATKPLGMVAWWKMDELIGATAVDDIVGFNNQGVPNPGGQVGSFGPLPVTGEVQGALYFATQYVVVSPQTELDFGPGDFSIDAWVKPVDCSHGAGGFFSTIVDKLSSGGTAPGFAFYFDQPNVGVAILYLNINGTLFNSGTGTIPTLGSATWSHIAVTVTRPSLGPAVGTFYINGVAVGTPFTPPVGPAGDVTNTAPLWIGRKQTPDNICEFAIDELELFNRALPQPEIDAIFQAGPLGKCP